MPPCIELFYFPTSKFSQAFSVMEAKSRTQGLMFFVGLLALLAIFFVGIERFYSCAVGFPTFLVFVALSSPFMILPFIIVDKYVGRASIISLAMALISIALMLMNKNVICFCYKSRMSSLRVGRDSVDNEPGLDDTSNVVFIFGGYSDWSKPDTWESASQIITDKDVEEMAKEDVDKLVRYLESWSGVREEFSRDLGPPSDRHPQVSKSSSDKLKTKKDLNNYVTKVIGFMLSKKIKYPSFLILGVPDPESITDRRVKDISELRMKGIIS